MNIEWFWLTCIVGIIAICVNSTCDSYFKQKYGHKKEEDDEE